MHYSSTIDSRGRVTVPQAIRRRLGLRAGERVDFVIEGGQIVFRPSRSLTNVFAKYNGVLCVFSGKKQINAWVRSLRDESK